MASVRPKGSATISQKKRVAKVFTDCPEKAERMSDKPTSDSTNAEFQVLLRKYLNGHPGSERELAREFKTSVGTITRWANGYSRPPEVACEAIIASLKRKMQERK